LSGILSVRSQAGRTDLLGPAPIREEQRTFFATVPEVAAKLKETHTKERKFEEVVKSVEQATVLVLGY
jgi:DNA replication protein DnaC